MSRKTVGQRLNSLTATVFGPGTDDRSESLRKDVNALPKTKHDRGWTDNQDFASLERNEVNCWIVLYLGEAKPTHHLGGRRRSRSN